MKVFGRFHKNRVEIRGENPPLCREGELNPHAPRRTADFESAASPNSAISASFFCHSGLDPESSLLCSPAPELRFSVLVKVKDYTRKTPYVNKIT